MSKLGQVVEAVEKYNHFVIDQVKRARSDEKFGRELINRWNETKAKTPVTHTPTGLPLPRLALPEIDEPGEIARYLFGEGLPGEFPFLNGAYREMYLEPVREIETGSYGKKASANGAKQKAGGDSVRPPEEPTRLFSGLMLAEDTNERFHYLTQHQRTHRLSTAFDGPTLYGIDSAALRRLRPRFAEFFRVHDHQRSSADHHGDVHRRGETAVRPESRSETARHDPS